MPLLALMESTPQTVLELSIQQVVVNAGDGRLKDNSLCSEELRSYLSLVPSEKLQDYITGCLEQPFDNSGLVLQEIVNELGKRLEYQVEPGLYLGRRNQVGFDGIWRIPNGNSLVVEVKTTDAYRIKLDTLGNYRQQLVAEGRITLNSSMLIVVGREDTGDLESQIRGSRYAWEMRVISVDALNKLVLLKEGTEEAETLTKIRSILTPFEYTRLDNLVDVIFTATKDVESSIKLEANDIADIENTEELPSRKYKFDCTPTEVIQHKREQILVAFKHTFGKSLIKKSKAMYWDVDKETRICCTISKRHNRSGTTLYWYAFHPQWNEFLQEAKNSYCIYGCVDQNQGFAIPLDIIQAHINELYISRKESGGMYWHIELIEENNKMYWLIRKTNTKIDLTPYALPLTENEISSLI